MKRVLFLAVVLMTVSVAKADTIVIALPPGDAFVLATKTASYACKNCGIKLYLVIDCNDEGIRQAVGFVMSHPEIFSENSAELVCNTEKGVYILKEGGIKKRCELLPGTGLSCE